VDVEIRYIAPEELEAQLTAVEAAFGSHVRPEWIDLHRPFVEVDRTLVAVENGEFVGGAGVNSFMMTVPGGRELPVAGVTAVGVKPSHRRRGINTALMRRQLDDIRERGETVAALYASEPDIYQRFGYGLGSLNGAMSLERAHSAFGDAYRSTGRVRLYDHDEALKVFLPVYERARRMRPGMFRMDEREFAFRFDERHLHDDEKDAKYFFAGHEIDGQVDAYAAYTIKHDWDESVSRTRLSVEDVQAVSAQAYADMWRFVLDVDLVFVVKAWNRPSDEPLLLLLREPRRLNLKLNDAMWVRVVDVPGALVGRGYAMEGRISFEVADRFCPWNEGRYVLEADPDGATCRRTDEEPDLAFTINELGSVYLGGTTFAQLTRATRIDERHAGAVARADAMFGTDVAPHCPVMF
jgi:predicted acetyltransferase